MLPSTFRCFLDRRFTWRVVQLDRRLQAMRSCKQLSEEHFGLSSERIPVLIIVDVEPDGFFIPREEPRPWIGYERLHEFLHELRALSLKVTGRAVHYCWYLRMDPQIAEVYGHPAWVRSRYSDFIDEYIAAGDEVGLHPHAYRWDKGVNSWVVDHGNQAWVDFCVRMSFEAFSKSFGRGCDSFRFGDRWMNDPTLKLIESLGARFDLTLEPGQIAALASFPDKPFTGSIPEYSNVPRTPFRPSERDFRKSDPSRSDGIWMIPLSTAARDECSALVRAWTKIIGDQSLAPMYYTLNMAHDPKFLIPAIDRAFCSSNSAYLAFVIRSDIASNPQLFANLKENFAGLLAHPLANRFVFSTPVECMRLLDLVQVEEESASRAQSH